MYAIRSYYVRGSGVQISLIEPGPIETRFRVHALVITSYSIHYTKLYDKNGIRLGERLLLQHKADYRDDSGMLRSDRRPAAGIMEVKRLYEDSAVLRSLNQYAPGNVQIGDLAVME